MMGNQPSPQDKLFYTGITLERRVRKNHPLRKISETIDHRGQGSRRRCPG